MEYHFGEWAMTLFTMTGIGFTLSVWSPFFWIPSSIWVYLASIFGGIGWVCLVIASIRLLNFKLRRIMFPENESE